MSSGRQHYGSNGCPEKGFVAVWQQAMENYNSARPWAGVAGPGGGVLATIKRIGGEAAEMDTCDAVLPHKWVTHHGVVDLLNLCPESVGDIADEATEKWLWVCEAKGNPNLAHLDKGCFFDPLFELLHCKNTKDWGGS